MSCQAWQSRNGRIRQDPESIRSRFQNGRRPSRSFRAGLVAALGGRRARRGDGRRNQEDQRCPRMTARPDATRDRLDLLTRRVHGSGGRPSRKSGAEAAHQPRDMTHRTGHAPPWQPWVDTSLSSSFIGTGTCAVPGCHELKRRVNASGVVRVLQVHDERRRPRRTRWSDVKIRSGAGRVKPPSRLFPDRIIDQVQRSGGVEEGSTRPEPTTFPSESPLRTGRRLAMVERVDKPNG